MPRKKRDCASPAHRLVLGRTPHNARRSAARDATLHAPALRRASHASTTSERVGSKSAMRLPLLKFLIAFLLCTVTGSLRAETPTLAGRWSATPMRSDWVIGEWGKPCGPPQPAA